MPAGQARGGRGRRLRRMLPVHDRLEAVLAALGISDQALRLVPLWQNWDMVMGPDIAPLAWPLGARRDVLLVAGEDNLALQELTLLTAEILERVNAFMAEPMFSRVDVQLLLGRRPLNVPAGSGF